VKTMRLQATAYHEAGHFFVAWHFRLTGKRGNGLSIVPEEGTSGRAHHRKVVSPSIEWDSSGRNRLRAEKLAMIYLAGCIAQRRFNPRSWRNYHGRSDFRNAAEVLSHITGSDEELSAHLRILQIRTEQLLEVADNWRLIQVLAGELLKHKQISSRDANAILLTACNQVMSKKGCRVQVR
jgi:hypothetical protein